MKRILLLITIVLSPALSCVYAQQYCGINGLIHIPTADMDTVGIARIGAHYIPKKIMPDKIRLDKKKYNSWTNYLSVTPFRWIEIGYGYTLLKLHKNQDQKEETGFYSKDRYFSVKLQPIQEDEWWPSVAVGGNDLWGSSDEGKSGSNYYKNYFVALSKHINLKGNLIGGHLTYRNWYRKYNHKWNGVVGGITFQPSFYQPLRLIAEWDGNEANIGADCRLFKYFLIQCAFIDMHRFNGGISLYIPLL